jgi:hypothetical protein
MELDQVAKASITACALERNTSERVRISVGKNGTTTSMPQELLFELNGARVTPHIATFGGTSYQIANIGKRRERPRGRRAADQRDELAPS